MTDITLEVLATKIDGLKDLFNEKFKTNEKQHKDIINRQDTANHRTTKVEHRNTLCENWQAKALGVFLAVNILFLPIIFILISKFL